MTDQKILEAIEKVLYETRLFSSEYAKIASNRVLLDIKPLLPPTDLVKVWEGETMKIEATDWDLCSKNIWPRFRNLSDHSKIYGKKHEVYIREVK